MAKLNIETQRWSHKRLKAIESNCMCPFNLTHRLINALNSGRQPLPGDRFVGPVNPLH